MQPRRSLFIVPALLVLISAACLCGAPSQGLEGAGAPPQAEAPSGSQPQTTATAAVAFGFAGPTPQPAIPEQRRLTLDFTPRIRVGDSEVIRLMLEVDDQGNVTPTASVEGNTVTGEVISIPNLYDTHNVIAEARFDLAGVEVRPPDLISEALLPGESVTFFWSVHPESAGTYRGTIWLHLRFVDKVSGAESRKTISAQVVEIEAANFLGFSGGLARTTGAVGSLVGGVLGIPFIDDIFKFLFRRRKR
jgi:hypothetical protein